MTDFSYLHVRGNKVNEPAVGNLRKYQERNFKGVGLGEEFPEEAYPETAPGLHLQRLSRGIGLRERKIPEVQEDLRKRLLTHLGNKNSNESLL